MSIAHSSDLSRFRDLGRDWQVLSKERLRRAGARRAQFSAKRHMIGHEVLDGTALTTGAFTLGGAAVGLAGGSAGRFLRDRQDVAWKREEKLDRQVERRRQIVIDFQAALDLYMRAVWDVHHWEIKTAKATGSWAASPRPAGIDHELWESTRRVRQLAEWVEDDELRQRFLALDRRVSNGLPRLTSEAAAGKFLRQVTQLLRTTQTRLGEVARPLL